MRDQVWFHNARISPNGRPSWFPLPLQVLPVTAAVLFGMRADKQILIEP